MNQKSLKKLTATFRVAVLFFLINLWLTIYFRRPKPKSNFAAQHYLNEEVIYFIDILENIKRVEFYEITFSFWFKQKIKGKCL